VPRTLLWCAALAVFAPAGRAEQTVTNNELIVRLTVSAKAAPRPALRYTLLPELKEMTSGNPIPNYLKCFLERDASVDRENLGGAALRQADRAARMDKPDWQLLPKLKTDGIGLLLPDVQKLRELAAALQERFRSEVALGHTNDALVTAKTMFALSRHMGEHPTLIGDLVGIAIAYVTISPLEDLLERPDCPNLYWALSNLPSPFISLEGGLAGERVLMRGEFHDIDDAAPMSADQIKKVVEHIDKVREIEVRLKNEKGSRAWLDARVKDPAAVAAARGRLVEVGYREELLKTFPADQVILLDEMREYEVIRDETMKLSRLPPWQQEALDPAQSRAELDKSLFGFLTPAFHKVRRASGRLEQRIALLRHVEALRMYAAAHDGKLPERLADCPVPLPDDPFTGKPFPYKVEGNTAHFRGTPPPGEKMNPAYNVRFEVTIRK
jgi:hypothetical protein